MPVPSPGTETAVGYKLLMLDLEPCLSFSWALSSVRFPTRKTLTQGFTCKQFIKKGFQETPVRDSRKGGATQECNFRSSPILSLKLQGYLEHKLHCSICLDSKGHWAITAPSTSMKAGTLLVLRDEKRLGEDLVLILYNFWGPVETLLLQLKLSWVRSWQYESWTWCQWTSRIVTNPLPTLTMDATY